jgi:hypothetical protein
MKRVNVLLNFPFNLFSLPLFAQLLADYQAAAETAKRRLEEALYRVEKSSKTGFWLLITADIDAVLSIF